MGELFDRLFNLLREIAWPFETVHSYEQGVKFRRGTDIAELGPGLWFRWWVLDEIHVIAIAEQTKNLLTQSITTADGVSITFSVNIVYRVKSARQMYVSVHDFDQSLEAAAMIHLAKQIRTRSWSELATAEGTTKLEQSLEGRLTTKLKNWGVEVVDVGITDLVQAKQHRLFGDASPLH